MPLVVPNGRKNAAVRELTHWQQSRGGRGTQAAMYVKDEGGSWPTHTCMRAWHAINCQRTQPAGLIDRRQLQAGQHTQTSPHTRACNRVGKKLPHKCAVRWQKQQGICHHASTCAAHKLQHAHTNSHKNFASETWHKTEKPESEVISRPARPGNKQRATHARSATCMHGNVATTKPCTKAV